MLFAIFSGRYCTTRTYFIAVTDFSHWYIAGIRVIPTYKLGSFIVYADRELWSNSFFLPIRALMSVHILTCAWVFMSLAISCQTRTSQHASQSPWFGRKTSCPSYPSLFHSTRLLPLCQLQQSTQIILYFGILHRLQLAPLHWWWWLGWIFLHLILSSSQKDTLVFFKFDFDVLGDLVQSTYLY